MTKTNFLPHLASTNTPASTNDIRALKAPVALASGWFWVWCELGLLLGLTAAWLLWRRYRRKQAAPVPVIVIPPHFRARTKLREALALLQQPRPFCILVSDTIRIYLEERFNLRAPERTTEEFLEELQTSALLSYDQKHALAEFLMGCDLVKFARYEPGPPELQGLYDAAVRLVEQTEPPPVEPQPGAPVTATQTAP